VNNAGITFDLETLQPIWNADEDLWDDIQQVNSKGVFLGCKWASRQMLNQDPHPNGDRGWIVNVASVFGLVGTSNFASYCASGGAIVNMTKAVALDCAPHRIHVNCICPGCECKDTPEVSVRTDDTYRDLIPDDKRGTQGRRDAGTHNQPASVPWTGYSGRHRKGCCISGFGRLFMDNWSTHIVPEGWKCANVIRRLHCRWTEDIQPGRCLREANSYTFDNDNGDTSLERESRHRTNKHTIGAGHWRVGRRYFGKGYMIELGLVAGSLSTLLFLVR